MSKTKSKSTKSQNNKQRKPSTNTTKQTQQPANTRIFGLIAVLVVGVVAAYMFLQPNAPAADPETLASAVGNPSVLMADAPQGLSPQDYMVSFRNAEVDHLLLDVRTRSEFDSGHIEGAVNIPLQELASRSNELPQDQPIVIYCRSGNRSAQAARLLDGQEFSGLYDMGGTIHWTAAGYPLV